MKPMQLRATDFDYDLPEYRIAKYPLAERDNSKLLVFDNGDLKEDAYLNIDQYLPENALLVFNNSKVIPSRLRFKNATGGRIEVFCLEPVEGFADVQAVMEKAGTAQWNCIVGGKKKWKQQFISCELDDLVIKAELIGRAGDYFQVAFTWEPSHLSFAELLEKVGEMPIPPYFKRDCEALDFHRYQTTFAKKQGSVAAPTAGLHFTEKVFEKIKNKQIALSYTTLYVGAGTFLPVKSDTIGGHIMHYEWIEATASLMQQLRDKLAENGPVIPVGTTSLRTLESLYWMGVKASQNPDATLEELEVLQWDPYQIEMQLSSVEALDALLCWMKRQETERLICKTQIIIVPSYPLKIAEVLITNFHQPRSTLLLLIGAFVGESWKRIYDHALDNDFRFLSYGDGCLLFKNK